MNDLIIMSIQGGRYLEAEKQLGEIILSNPSVDAYFMLGTTKSNLLLDKGRSYLEVQFCFNKCLELSSNKSECERNIMVFCVGLYSQLAELEKNLFQQRKKEATNLAIGALVTFASSKLIDSSKHSFGAISGLVGAGFGIGMSMDSLSNIGTISDMISYVSRIKVEMIEYLKQAITIEKDLLSSEILTLSDKFGTITQTDRSIDISILQSLGSYFVEPNKAIAMIVDSDNFNFAVKTWKVKGLFSHSQFEVPNGESVLGGFSSHAKNIMEFLFTNKGVYHCVDSRFRPYKDVKFKTTSGAIAWNDGILPKGTFGKVNNCESVASTLNDFVNQMSSLKDESN